MIKNTKLTKLVAFLAALVMMLGSFPGRYNVTIAYSEDETDVTENIQTGSEDPCANGHSWDGGTITAAPTCTAEGVKTFTCTVCGATNTEPIPATGHTEAVDAAISPTCTATGLTEGRHCSVCGEVIVAQETVPAAGHKLTAISAKEASLTEDGANAYWVCSVCGKYFSNGEGTNEIAEGSWIIAGSRDELIRKAAEEEAARKAAEEEAARKAAEEEAARKAAEEEAARKAAEEEAARKAAEEEAARKAAEEEAARKAAEEEAAKQTEVSEQIGGEPAPEMDQPEPSADEDFDDFEEFDDFDDFDEFEDDEDDEDYDDDDTIILDDWDAGVVSTELLERFNSTSNYEQMEFNGTAGIELQNEGMLRYGDEIRLEAKVQDVNLSYRLIWEANDNDDRGWYTIASGERYSYTLTAENLDREYRVVLFSLD